MKTTFILSGHIYYVVKKERFNQPRTALKGNKRLIHLLFNTFLLFNAMIFSSKTSLLKVGTFHSYSAYYDLTLVIHDKYSFKWKSSFETSFKIQKNT